MDEIRIKGLEVFAHHGVFEPETQLGQKFYINATLGADLRPAGKSDCLTHTVNYGEICAQITKFLTEHTFQLIETAAEQLAEYLLQTIPLLEQLTLEIEKPWAPIHMPLKTVSVCITRRWHTAYIALGSNLGDKKAYLDAAVQALRADQSMQVGEISDYIITEPYGGVEQDDFLNGCVCVRTLLTPHELLDRLHEIEQQQGRERLIHWGPRTLDLDILLYDNLVMADKTLVIPHPEIAKRAFVLKPLAQIAPHLVHPVSRKTIAELLEQVN